MVDESENAQIWIPRADNVNAWVFNFKEIRAPNPPCYSMILFSDQLPSFQVAFFL